MLLTLLGLNDCELLVVLVLDGETEAEAEAEADAEELSRFVFGTINLGIPGAAEGSILLEIIEDFLDESFSLPELNTDLESSDSILMLFWLNSFSKLGELVVESVEC